MTTIVCGSAEDRAYWKQFHWDMAIKFSRLKYPLDETEMYYHLLVYYDLG